MSSTNLEQYLKNRRRRSSAVSLPLFTGKDAVKLLREETSNSLHQGKKTSVFSSEPLWEPRDAASVAAEKRSTKSNLLDKSTLYSVKRENIASREMEFRARPLVRHSDDPNFNLEQKRERDYIVNARLGDNSLGKFSRAIIQHFFKAPAPKSHPGYGMPRPETRESNPFRVMMQDLQRDPSMLQISSFPSLTNPIKCESGNEFCEILGSSACSTCIEKTNRYIGDELQRIMFPKMDLTRQRLVQPKLARVMKEGHMMQVRKRRLRELHFPDHLSVLKRRETQITEKSAHFKKSAKRKRKQKTLNSFVRATPMTPGIALATVKEESIASV
ncbi:uncharacterized protein LOC128184377 [Crassostrea angulata]|uniref:Uncharacterized protein n=1 Tax=Magallana gigas TaxID=29159 RepID=K1QEK8_MAGGI|nr:uncharacterized protein LOC128184377 [Crassostrea angulata]|eukprot:XP_011424156.1 PREDICTED: uncharacterized protein LOC105326022 [Crassostrea gigas]